MLIIKFKRGGKTHKAEKKVVKALDSNGANQLISILSDTFDGVKNKIIILILVDCGLRLGKLLNIKVSDINVELQSMRVNRSYKGFISHWPLVQIQ